MTTLTLKKRPKLADLRLDNAPPPARIKLAAFCDRLTGRRSVPDSAVSGCEGVLLAEGLVLAAEGGGNGNPFVILALIGGSWRALHSVPRFDSAITDLQERGLVKRIEDIEREGVKRRRKAREAEAARKAAADREENKRLIAEREAEAEKNARARADAEYRQHVPTRTPPTLGIMRGRT